jgi:nitroreductase
MSETINSILNRTSVRKYTDKKVSKEDRDILIKAALASPSAGNSQPWHFSIVEDSEKINDIDKYLAINAFGEDSDRFKSGEYKLLYKPTLLIVVSSPLANVFNSFDSGVATENIAIAAKGLGLDTLIVGNIRYIEQGDKTQDYINLLGIPDGYKVIVAISVGYSDIETKPHELDYSKVTFVEETNCD